MTGKGHELVNFMERRSVNVLCVQETKWKGEKTKELGNGLKLFYSGAGSRRNGVGIVLDDMMKRDVIMVKRRSDRVMWLKTIVEGQLVNFMSGYAPQTGCDKEEKEKFWEEMFEELAMIPREEQVWIGGDFNGRVGGGNTGVEQVIGQYGVGQRNDSGQTLVDFAMGMDLVACNTLFKKTERHRVTYKSGKAETQIDYILCRKDNKGDVRDCKVILGESVASQHRPVVCKVKINMAERTSVRAAAAPKIR